MADMTNIEQQILEYLCTGLGEGNSNTNKITKHIVELNPDLKYNEAKVMVVEGLHNLISRGELQILTIKWEFGEEFLYICTNRL